MLLNCKSITKVETNRGFKNISTKSLLKNISKEELSYKYLFLRSQATIIKNGRTNQFNLRIRIKNKDKILISGSLLIPLFKGLVTKQEVVFYEKFNKTYYQGSYKYLSKILNFELSLNSLENLLVGRPIEDLESIRLSQEKNIKFTVMAVCVFTLSQESTQKSSIDTTMCQRTQRSALMPS